MTLGITENPVRVRLFGPRHTPLDVRSRGTRHVIDAMRRHGVRRLIALTSYGVGATRGRLGFVDRRFFEPLLKPQIQDTELKNQNVVDSGLDWSIVQPVHLTNGEGDSLPFASTTGATERMQISRKSVARFMAEAVTSPAFVGQSVALSGSFSGAASRQISRATTA